LQQLGVDLRVGEVDHDGVHDGRIGAEQEAPFDLVLVDVVAAVLQGLKGGVPDFGVVVDVGDLDAVDLDRRRDLPGQPLFVVTAGFFMGRQQVDVRVELVGYDAENTRFGHAARAGSLGVTFVDPSH
jgi:hypothetical protein